MCLIFLIIPVILLSFLQIGQKHILQTNISKSCTNISVQELDVLVLGYIAEKLLKNGKIFVPTSVVDMVVKRMRSFAHQRVSKSKGLSLRKFAFLEDLDAHVQARIARRATYATCKARNHPSQDTMEHYPIPDHP